MFFHGLLGLIVSSIYLPIDCYLRQDYQFFGSYSLSAYLLLLTGSLVEPMCIYSGLKSAQCGQLGFIGLVQYIAIVYAFLIDLLVFKEDLQIVDVAASLIIVIATVWVSVEKIRQESSAKITDRDQDYTRSTKNV